MNEMEEEGEKILEILSSDSNNDLDKESINNIRTEVVKSFF